MRLVLSGMMLVATLLLQLGCESDNFRTDPDGSDKIVDSDVLIASYCEKLRGCLVDINCDEILTPSQEACEEDFTRELSDAEIENYNRVLDSECSVLTSQLCGQSGYYFEAICECPDEAEPPACADGLFCINPRGQFPGNGGVCLEADGDAAEDARTCVTDTDCRCSAGQEDCSAFDICMKPIFREIENGSGADAGLSVDDTTNNDGLGWCASYCVDSTVLDG